jgi:hypothetical protein
MIYEILRWGEIIEFKCAVRIQGCQSGDHCHLIAHAPQRNPATFRASDDAAVADQQLTGFTDEIAASRRVDQTRLASVNRFRRETFKAGV